MAALASRPPVPEPWPRAGSAYGSPRRAAPPGAGQAPRPTQPPLPSRRRLLARLSCPDHATGQRRWPRAAPSALPADDRGSSVGLASGATIAQLVAHSALVHRPRRSRVVIDILRGSLPTRKEAYNPEICPVRSPRERIEPGDRPVLGS